MKKSNKILLWIILALIFIIGCGAAGFMKASQHQQVTEKTTKSNPKKESKSKESPKQKTDNKKDSTATPNQSSESKTSSATQPKNNTYYQGSKEITLPATSGTVNTTQYWPATMTIDGSKQSVIASYTNMGDFEVYTSKPTGRNYSFIYNGTSTHDGSDYQKYIGSSDLDSIPK